MYVPSAALAVASISITNQWLSQICRAEKSSKIQKQIPRVK
jgi:hypothetical protein